MGNGDRERPGNGIPARLASGILALTFALSLSTSGCSTEPAPTSNPTLRIFAAASLRDVAGELADAFRRQENVDILLNTAGSNTLAQQIQATDGADLFISADRQWVDYLEGLGRTAAGSRRDVFSNRLVLVARRGSPHRIDGLHGLVALPFRHLALADPDGVPAGRYARAHLEAVADVSAPERSLWDALRERVVPTLDVRAALALSESDPQILAMVYRTDALQSSAVEILYELDTLPEISIAYCAAVVEGAPQAAVARRFLDFLASPEGTGIVLEHGFEAL